MTNHNSLLCLFVTLCVLFPAKAWTRGMHFGGGSSVSHFGGSQFSQGGGFFGGGVYRNFGNPGPYTNYGSSMFRSPNFGRSVCCSQGQFFTSRRSFHSGVPFFSPGFSRHDFVFRQGFGPAGPLPLGAPGPTPFAQTIMPRARFPFFCSLHGFGYTNQQEFFGHLNFAHHVPLDRAAFFCQSAGNGLTFDGF